MKTKSTQKKMKNGYNQLELCEKHFFEKVWKKTIIDNRLRVNIIE